MLKQIIIISSIVVLMLTGCSKTEKTSVEKPNVILILTDDQGIGDLGFYGNPVVKTPVIDSLASKSVRFDEFLVSPVCAPTRASIMTGRYSMRTGVHDTYRGGSMMAASEVTIAEVLKQGNYKTGMIGKWHLGDNYPMRPQDQGFDYVLNHLSGGIGQPGDWPNTVKGNTSYFDPILWENGKQKQTKGYCSDVFGQAAIDFVQENKDNPFFLYLSFNAPHTPLQVPEEYYNIYKDIDPTKGFENDTKPFPKVHEKAKDYARKVYGMVTNIDDNLGRLFNKLNELNLDQKTLIIFMTDNGPQDPRYIAGLRGKKSSVFQGGVKVPSFWYYPKGFKGNRDVKTPTAHLDVLPTLAAFCGVKVPDTVQIDGINLLPVLTNENATLPKRTINNYWTRSAPVKYKNVSSRKDSLKLVALAKTPKGKDEFALFDMEKDPYELNNIADHHPKKVKELQGEMESWLSKMLTTKNYLHHPKTIIGTKYETPTFLNLNDAAYHKEKGMKKPFVNWEVNFSKTGLYNIKVNTYQKITTGGELILTIGDTTKKIGFENPNGRELIIEDVKISKGDKEISAKIFTKVNNKLQYVMPLYLEVELQD